MAYTTKYFSVDQTWVESLDDIVYKVALAEKAQGMMDRHLAAGVSASLLCLDAAMSKKDMEATHPLWMWFTIVYVKTLAAVEKGLDVTPETEPEPAAAAASGASSPSPAAEDRMKHAFLPKKKGEHDENKKPIALPDNDIGNDDKVEPEAEPEEDLALREFKKRCKMAAVRVSK